MPKAVSQDMKMSYRIGRGEQGVLTFEPYKSELLPLWRFRTVELAKESSETLWEKFLNYDKNDDFVGMDMTRKFIQMGMTRAKRYANHAGGRKYAKLESQAHYAPGEHPGAQEKLAASLVFKAVWERCKEHEGYRSRKEKFLAEQKAYQKTRILKVDDP